MVVNAFMHKARNRREKISPGMRIYPGIKDFGRKRVFFQM